MKNEEIYKTAEERMRGFKTFCDKHECSSCPCSMTKTWLPVGACRYSWLSLEGKEEEPKQDLPFKVDIGKAMVAIRRTDTQEVIFYDNYMIYKNALETTHRKCDKLNAAALAWHERMKKEGK